MGARIWKISCSDARYRVRSQRSYFHEQEFTAGVRLRLQDPGLTNVSATLPSGRVLDEAELRASLKRRG